MYYPRLLIHLKMYWPELNGKDRINKGVCHHASFLTKYGRTITWNFTFVHVPLKNQCEFILFKTYMKNYNTWIKWNNKV